MRSPDVQIDNHRCITALICPAPINRVASLPYKHDSNILSVSLMLFIQLHRSPESQVVNSGKFGATSSG